MNKMKINILEKNNDILPQVLILIFIIWFIWQSFKDEKLLDCNVHAHEIDTLGQKKEEFEYSHSWTNYECFFLETENKKKFEELKVDTKEKYIWLDVKSKEGFKTFIDQDEGTYPFRVFGFCVLNNPFKTGTNFGTFHGETDQNVKIRGKCNVQRAKWYQR